MHTYIPVAARHTVAVARTRVARTPVRQQVVLVAAAIKHNAISKLSLQAETIIYVCT
jgi:hypothetical protein